MLVLHHVANTSAQLEGEPKRVFNRVLAFDGNGSMKRMYQMGERAVTNMKPFTDTSYLLAPEYVDKFKDEVSSRRGPAVIERQDEQEDHDDSWEDAEEGSPEENLIAGCTKNWKAASQEGKSSWAAFNENGWFVSACRHSLILWFSDMIRSGELWVLTI